MAQAFSDSVALITSSDPTNDRFGTGFIARRTGDIVYVVTCAHVVQDVGTETLRVNGISGTVVKTGDHLDLDLAVVKVEGLIGEMDDELPLEKSEVTTGHSVVTEGFQVFDPRNQTRMKRPLRGTLAEQIAITAKFPSNPVRAWELKFEEGDVQPGYSGSPILDAQTHKVIGVVSHRLRQGVGVAIAIEELNRIWQPIERQHLKNALMRLGYREQTKLFRQSLDRNPIGAYLIHGPTEHYGQQWLVNRLLQQHVPTSMAGKTCRISLSRVGRRGDVRGLWAEMAMELKCDRNATPEDIAKRAVQWWRSRDLILAIYDVDCLSEELLNLLIQEFWLPLANEAEGMRSQGTPHKLLMFLIDNEAVTAQRNVPFTEKIDADSKTYYPVKSPQNREFSRDELIYWMDAAVSELPREMTERTDETVDDMYERSDSGIPEWTFVEICQRCGYDWRTELPGWCSI